MTAARQFVERKTPELFKFDTKNVPISGTLIAADFVPVTDKKTQEVKPVLRYIIENEDGTRRIKLLATYDLAEKLGKTDVGRFVRIAWIGENADAGTDGNAMKLFKVEVAKEEEDAA